MKFHSVKFQGVKFEVSNVAGFAFRRANPASGGTAWSDQSEPPNAEERRDASGRGVARALRLREGAEDLAPHVHQLIQRALVEQEGVARIDAGLDRP